MLCDAHTHFFSYGFFGTLANQAAETTGKSATDLLARIGERTGIELPSRITADHANRWIRELNDGGVDHAVAFASVPPEGPTVIEACASSGERLIPYLTCDPSQREGIEAAADGLRRGGRGILLFPAIQHFDPASPSLDPLYEQARASGAPVVVHCGVLQIKLRDLLGVRPRYDLRHATPLGVSAAAERHPKVTFVLPHFGGGFFQEALIAGAQSPNVWVDTSSSNSWMSAQSVPMELHEVFDRVLGVFGPDRILFGTDSSTFPRGWRRDLFEAQDAALDRLGADASIKRRIFGENLAGLLDL